MQALTTQLQAQPPRRWVRTSLLQSISTLGLLPPGHPTILQLCSALEQGLGDMEPTELMQVCSGGGRYARPGEHEAHRSDAGMQRWGQGCKADAHSSKLNKQLQRLGLQVVQALGRPGLQSLPIWRAAVSTLRQNIKPWAEQLPSQLAAALQSVAVSGVCVCACLRRVLRQSSFGVAQQVGWLPSLLHGMVSPQRHSSA